MTQRATGTFDVSLTSTVVPDSGTEQPSGLAGTITLTTVVGKHAYTFDYSLPNSERNTS
jgi:hypothetical protein